MHSAPGTTRDLPLDFVKGVPVIVMVTYHVMNIFSTASAEAYGYIRFVNGSFILNFWLIHLLFSSRISDT